MALEDARRLMAYVGGMALRCRTGILCLGHRDLGAEADIAARLRADHADWTDRLLSDCAPGAHRLSYSWLRQADLMRRLSNDEGSSGRIVVANFDFGLSGLAPDDASRLWSYLRTDLVHSRNAIIVALPECALDLSLPAHELQEWDDEGRLARL